MTLLIALVFSLIGTTICSIELRFANEKTPHLSPKRNVDYSTFSDIDLPSVSVIIPTYNEATNIQDCLLSVLASTKLLSEEVEVWIVDDQSTDATLVSAQSLQQKLHDPRLKILIGQSRPEGQMWIGKNWACAQGAQQAKGEFLLFIDADVRLKPGAIETVVQVAEQEKIDLLNCLPALICESWVEWLVQPLMFNNMLVAFHCAAVNDPKTKTAFAAGPVMLFRRSAYEQVGGHQAVATQVAEDVALAQCIKRSGQKLKYVLAPELASVRMYCSWASLWEGWTKVLYSGADRSLPLMLCLALVMVGIYSIPWLGLAIVFCESFVTPLEIPDFLSIAIVLIAISLQYCLRRLGAQVFHSSTRYWWLSGLGGVLIAVMALASVVKTETGWGWTWRGRSLKR